MSAPIDKDQQLTSHDVAKLLQVNPTRVNKWIGDGHIAAFRTPGGHRRVRLGDVFAFSAKFKMPIAESRLAELLGTVTINITPAGRAALQQANDQ